jgi:hypothetical protein
MCGDALPFINYANAAVPGRDKWFIINMDQTPLYFSMHFKCMLEKMGLHTVNVLCDQQCYHHSTRQSVHSNHTNSLIHMKVMQYRRSCTNIQK